MIAKKQIFTSIGILVLIFVLLKFISKAETINSIQTCNEQQCLTNISGVEISNTGNFFLITDSASNPYLRKIDFSSNMIGDDRIFFINENNTGNVPFKIDISNDSKKALMYKETRISETVSSSSSSGSLIHVLDFENNTVKSIIPYLLQEKSNVVSKVTNNEGINVASFLDEEGGEILASSNNSDAPELYIIDSTTGEITQSIEIPDIANSIELSSDFETAVITFKSLFVQSIGIYNVGVKKITKIDIPEDIFFEVGAFLSNVSFDLKSKKSVISSFGGKHVLYLVDLDKGELIVRFLSNTQQGKTRSAISPDGTSVVSASEIDGKNQIVIYKVDASDLKRMNIEKRIQIKDSNTILDVQITPDGNNVLVLLLDNNGKKIKVLRLNDLSNLCEYVVSSDVNESSISIDPYGQFLLIPELQGDSVSLITDLNSGPIFRSISPPRASSKESAQFTIDGYVDSTKFKDDFKVCFRSGKFCAMSISISDDGKLISGITPKVPFKSRTSVLLIGKDKKREESISSSGASSCKKQNNTRSRYKDTFSFE